MASSLAQQLMSQPATAGSVRVGRPGRYSDRAHSPTRGCNRSARSSPSLKLVRGCINTHSCDQVLIRQTLDALHELRPIPELTVATSPRKASGQALAQKQARPRRNADPFGHERILLAERGERGRVRRPAGLKPGGSWDSWAANTFWPKVGYILRTLTICTSKLVKI